MSHESVNTSMDISGENQSLMIVSDATHYESPSHFDCTIFSTIFSVENVRCLDIKSKGIEV